MAPSTGIGLPVSGVFPGLRAGGGSLSLDGHEIPETKSQPHLWAQRSLRSAAGLPVTYRTIAPDTAIVAGTGI